MQQLARRAQRERGRARERRGRAGSAARRDRRLRGGGEARGARPIETTRERGGTRRARAPGRGDAGRPRGSLAAKRACGARGGGVRRDQAGAAARGVPHGRCRRRDRGPDVRTPRSGVYSSLGAFTRFVAFSTADRPYPSAPRCVRCVRAMSDGASLTSAWVLPCVLVRSSKWRTAPARPRTRARTPPSEETRVKNPRCVAVVRLFVRFDIFIQQRQTRVRTSIATSLGSPAVSGNNVRDDE